jgi:hypothetical protein
MVLLCRCRCRRVCRCRGNVLSWRASQGELEDAKLVERVCNILEKLGVPADDVRMSCRVSSVPRGVCSEHVSRLACTCP